MTTQLFSVAKIASGCNTKSAADWVVTRSYLLGEGVNFIQCFFLNFIFQLNVVVNLQLNPEVSRISKKLGKSQSGINRHPSFPSHYLTYPCLRNECRFGQAIRWNSKCIQKLDFQHFPRVYVLYSFHFSDNLQLVGNSVSLQVKFTIMIHNTHHSRYYRQR